MNTKRNSTSSSTSTDDGYNSEPNQSNADHQKHITRDTAIFKKKYQVIELLTNSANGTVYAGIDITTKRRVVIKQVPKTSITNFVNVDGRPVPREFHLHRLASSSTVGVVRAIEWFERRSSWTLVMERPDNCIDLFDFTSQYGTMTDECVIAIIKRVVATCHKLHDIGIFHRDIKDENILFNPSTLETFVIDFGCAKQTSSKRQTFRSFAGTPDYTAPEYFSTGVLDQEKSTIWSIGCLVYILLHGDVPFKSKDDIVNGQFELVSPLYLSRISFLTYFIHRQIKSAIKWLMF